MVERRLQQLTEEYHAFQKRAVYVGVILLIVSIVLSAGALIISNRAARNAAQEAQRASELSLCRFIINQTDRYRKEPPTTPAGEEQARGMEQLRRDLRCDSGE